MTWHIQYPHNPHIPVYSFVRYNLMFKWMWHMDGQYPMPETWWKARSDWLITGVR